MNTKAMSIEMSKSRVSAPILEKAARIARGADVHPHRVRKTLLSLGVILVVGIASTIASLIIIGADLVQSEQGRLVITFSLLGALAVCLGAIFSLLLVIWSAYVNTYVQSLNDKAHIAEATDDCYQVVLAAVELAHDQAFSHDVAYLVASEISEDAATIADKLSAAPSFKNKLYTLIRNQLARKQEVACLIEEVESNERRVTGALTGR